MRRAEITPSTAAHPSFSAGGLFVNFNTREVRRDGRPVQLTPIEYNLLYHLIRNVGRVIPHSTLLARVWGHEGSADLGSLKVYIRRLRQEIEKDPSNPTLVLTERGIGYRFARPAR
jgi:DNA-binding response OmpR family regulator